MLCQPSYICQLSNLLLVMLSLLRLIKSQSCWLHIIQFGSTSYTDTLVLISQDLIIIICEFLQTNSNAWSLSQLISKAFVLLSSKRSWIWRLNFFSIISNCLCYCNDSFCQFNSFTHSSYCDFPKLNSFYSDLVVYQLILSNLWQNDGHKFQ